MAFYPGSWKVLMAFSGKGNIAERIHLRAGVCFAHANFEMSIRHQMEVSGIFFHFIECDFHPPLFFPSSFTVELKWHYLCSFALELVVYDTRKGCWGFRMGQWEIRGFSAGT